MIEFELLLGIVEELTKLSREEILSKRKFRSFADVRVICSVLLKKYKPELKTKEIGKLLNVNHSSVCHHRNKHGKLMETDAVYKDMFNEIDLAYQQKMVIVNKSFKEVNKSFKESLINKKKRLEKMLTDINYVLESIEDGQVIKME